MAKMSCLRCCFQVRGVLKAAEKGTHTRPKHRECQGKATHSMGPPDRQRRGLVIEHVGQEMPAPFSLLFDEPTNRRQYAYAQHRPRRCGCQQSKCRQGGAEY